MHITYEYNYCEEGSIPTIDKVLMYEWSKWFCLCLLGKVNQFLLTIISTTSDTNWIENGDIYLKQKGKFFALKECPYLVVYS